MSLVYRLRNLQAAATPHSLILSSLSGLSLSLSLLQVLQCPVKSPTLSHASTALSAEFWHAFPRLVSLQFHLLCPLPSSEACQVFLKGPALCLHSLLLLWKSWLFTMFCCFSKSGKLSRVVVERTSPPTLVTTVWRPTAVTEMV